MAKKKSVREKMTNSSDKKSASSSSGSNSSKEIKIGDKSMFYEPSILTIIILTIILLININASVWISKLEKINCACSDNYMRNYIKYFLFVMIPFIIIQLCVAIYVYFNVSDIKSVTISTTTLMIIAFFRFIFGIFYIINICIAIIYISKLKELNCECSEDVRREVYWIYNIILASIFCILILILIIFVVTLLFTTKIRSGSSMLSSKSK